MLDIASNKVVGFVRDVVEGVLLSSLFFPVYAGVVFGNWLLFLKKEEVGKNDGNDGDSDECRGEVKEGGVYVPFIPPHIQRLEKKVLLLGDGNFSFSMALTQLLWNNAYFSERAEKFLEMNDTENLAVIPTSFDTEKELYDKYPETRHILRRMKAHYGATTAVFHQINAWEIVQQFPFQKFKAIVWNHPHLGVEDFRLHRFLMAHFFHSAKQCLDDDGIICVSLVTGQAERWEMVEQAQKCGLLLFSKTSFHPEEWPGYETRRNRTGNSFQNIKTQKHTKSGMSSLLFKFKIGVATESKNGTCKKFVVTQHQAESSRDEIHNDEESSSLARLPKVETFKDKQHVPKAPIKEGEFFCHQCNKSFTLARGLKTHVRQVHELKKYGKNWKPKMEKQFQCDTCNRSFHDQEAKWQHMVSKHSESPAVVDKQLEGNKGDISISSSQRFTDMLTAEDVTYVPCDVCGQAVPSHWHIDQHLEMLKPLVGIKAKCKLCETVFTEHRALKQHLNFCRVSIHPDFMVAKKSTKRLKMEARAKRLELTN
eukprot:m.21735 g.21735  ORF g.21735 m.21735 type:complete len:538 (-) comp5382_c0_seq1:675-2288(-)